MSDRRPPMLDWCDRVMLAICSKGSGPCVVAQCREGGPGAIEVRGYGDHDCARKPVWEVKRWVNGEVTVSGELTEAGWAALAVVRTGDWLPRPMEAP